MLLNSNFTNGMLKYAGLWSGAATAGYKTSRNIGKSLLTTQDPVTKATRFSAKKIALTGAGLYAGTKLLGEAGRKQDNLSRDYMDDVHPYRQSDTLRMAR